MGAPGHQDQS
jgi:DNA replication licensing factor MCM4